MNTKESKLLYRDVKVITPLTSKHPKVLEVWETGSCSALPDGPMFYHIHFILRGGGRNQFKGEDPKQVFADAEKWLQELPID